MIEKRELCRRGTLVLPLLRSAGLSTKEGDQTRRFVPARIGDDDRIWTVVLDIEPDLQTQDVKYDFLSEEVSVDDNSEVSLIDGKADGGLFVIGTIYPRVLKKQVKLWMEPGNWYAYKKDLVAQHLRPFPHYTEVTTTTATEWDPAEMLLHVLIEYTYHS